MWGVTERRIARRYDLSLPVLLRVPVERDFDARKGETRDISARGLYFVTDKDLRARSELEITLVLPTEIARRVEVLVHAHARVVRVERRPENGRTRVGVAAVFEHYHISRSETGRA